MALGHEAGGSGGKLIGNGVHDLKLGVMLITYCCQASAIAPPCAEGRPRYVSGSQKPNNAGSLDQRFSHHRKHRADGLHPLTIISACPCLWPTMLWYQKLR